MVNVSIVDFGLSNLNSVISACEHVGMKATIVSNPKQILKSNALILPGVGAFGNAMKNLKKNGMDKSIIEFYKKGKQIFGICLGMQLLFDESNENGKFKGLGIIKGKVRKFDNKHDIVPNIGWNKISVMKKNVNKNEKSSLDNSNGQFFYFVHSYYCEPKDKKSLSSISNFGKFDFCSSIIFKNIEAYQFHPEKSGKNGLNIYNNIKNKIKKNN
jgi:imidazole glycerol-phosphate synthase subunit HisH